MECRGSGPVSGSGPAFAWKNCIVCFRAEILTLGRRSVRRAVVAVLLAAGLDVNVRTAGGTALHEAALCGKVEVVRTLLDGGVDLGIRDSQHNTVMDLLGQFPAHVTHDITAIIKSKS